MKSKNPKTPIVLEKRRGYFLTYIDYNVIEMVAPSKFLH